MQSNFDYSILEFIPKSLNILKKIPKKLYYTGNKKLLEMPIKVAIVGTRSPTPYAKNFTFALSKKISALGGIVVSGGALGIDIVAQSAAFPDTIMVSPASLDIIYPSTNARIISQIAKNGLILSEYEKNYIPKKYSFIERNRIVIALSDWVVIPQADMNSGSMQSAQIAEFCKKPIFVLPQRIDESSGTNFLLQNSLARAIYDIDIFLEMIFGKQEKTNDEILNFCEKIPTFEEAYSKYGDKILEYELEGKIKRQDGYLKVIL
ncbi:DNA-processing protein DprA [Helicobacter sp. 13S00477-4]|uniref:DNA-processing protein DprA n=1 Tax=Helicobacter sp. 13S00477-4 TaxID=1905759 RepID=UPI000BA58CB2|nr:DNA-processing protein DprA [Helicobacter sp. 13S00477-4]PAF52408.1 DNA protecting protein DprA [Helicobacter sp. 13S00477-4]